MTSNQTQSATGVGMLAHLFRRAGNTTLDLQVPFTLSTTTSLFGSGILSYSTPRYAIGYGPESLSVLGQLGVGSTLRGVFFTLPANGGDVTAFAGPALFNQGDSIRLYGVRERRLVAGRLFEYGLAMTPPGSGIGSSLTLLTGTAQRRGDASVVLEAALQRLNASAENPGGAGIAAQARIDWGKQNNLWSLTTRTIPSDFIAFGTGQLQGDRLFDISRISQSRHGTSTFDLAFERSLLNGEITTQRRTSYILTGQLTQHVGYSFNLFDQALGGSSGSQWDGTVGGQFSFSGRMGFLSLSEQLGRYTSIAAAPTGTAQSAVQSQLRLGALALTMTDQELRTAGGLTGVGHQGSFSAQLGRTSGKTTISLNFMRTLTQNEISDAISRIPTISVTRQISPAFSLTASYGTESLVDRLNPEVDGRSRIFNLQVNAPFVFGSGALVQGRVDPHLPATISGRVTLDSGSAATYLVGSGSYGVANAMVVLDGRYVQRTDLNGNYQFSFVTPGQHQLRLETSSLPRGLTADSPVVTLTVQGGQNAQVGFLVGDFGGVAGHVYGISRDGERVPLANVLVRVDSGAYSQTDSSGAYGFGRLSPGEHTVSVLENSVPAFATFSKKELTQKVNVIRGQLAHATFTAEPLGSISGYVLYAKDVPKPYVAGDGALNAYVVAEPGNEAAIANDDGSFVLDDLPPGTYTLSIDPETVADGLGQVSPDLTITLKAREHYKGAIFKISRKKKKVLFTFFGNAGAAAPTVAPSLQLSEPRLPPGGAAEVTVTAPADAELSASAFGQRVPLHYNAAHKRWSGEVVVPKGTRAGRFEVRAHAAEGRAPLPAELTVDPRLPIAILSASPAQAKIGEYVTVRARFLADVRPGDRILWADGQKSVLGKPLVGRLFAFTLKLSARPMVGTLVTAHGRFTVRLQ
ncbi:MAG: MSCRAMM family protein [Candidatus Baltobacteraceae bacterium]